MQVNKTNTNQSMPPATLQQDNTNPGASLPLEYSHETSIVAAALPLQTVAAEAESSPAVKAEAQDLNLSQEMTLPASLTQLHELAELPLTNLSNSGKIQDIGSLQTLEAVQLDSINLPQVLPASVDSKKSSS
jgi:hypothetical protein